MTKPKFKLGGVVRPDSIFHLCQEIDGEWYAIITARSDGKGAEPIIAIAGPFGDREEASDHNGKCMELSRRDRQFYLVDMSAVPSKVRQRITDDVRRGWRQGDFERLRACAAATIWLLISHQNTKRNCRGVASTCRGAVSAMCGPGTPAAISLRIPFTCLRERWRTRRFRRRPHTQHPS